MEWNEYNPHNLIRTRQNNIVITPETKSIHLAQGGQMIT